MALVAESHTGQALRKVLEVKPGSRGKAASRAEAAAALVLPARSRVRARA